MHKKISIRRMLHICRLTSKNKVLLRRARNLILQVNINKSVKVKHNFMILNNKFNALLVFKMILKKESIFLTVVIPTAMIVLNIGPISLTNVQLVIKYQKAL
jgi:hypothetical protein